MIARVVPLTRTRAVRGSFDYLLGDRHGDVVIGSVLRLPFGRQRALGVVVELAGTSELEPERLLEPDEALPISIPPDLVELAEWMAREYCSTPARALSLMLPPGIAAGRGVKRVLVAELTEAGAAALANGASPLNPHQRELLAALQSAGATLASELGTGALRRLESRGLVSIEARVSPRRPALRPLGAAAAQPPPLTADQRSALNELQAAQEQRFLLHGVTGSGKTEVYLHAVQAGARGWQERDRAGARDRAHAAGPVALSGPVRGRRRGPALGARRRRAPRRVAAPANRRGARLRRPQVGGVRAGR